MGKKILQLTLVITSLLSLPAYGQETIVLVNPSFEDTPRKGGSGAVPIKGWHDCGRSRFPDESPPDIHPVVDHAWDVAVPPVDGNTYLGMVTRANDSWESVSQALSAPIEGDACYSFSCYLVQSPEYRSATKRTQEMGTHELENFVRPAVLKIWGGNFFCDKAELLGESPAVTNEDWKYFKFTFQPKKTHRYITLEAFYKTPILEAYNGHILIDGLSDIEPIDCPLFPQDLIAEVFDPPAKVVVNHSGSSGSASTTIKKHYSGSSGSSSTGKTGGQGKKPFKPVYLTELEGGQLFIGKKIRIPELYFQTDSVNIEPESFKVLDELAHFMLEYPKVVLEIGGHTNTIPPDSYCNFLSTERAKSVRNYLVSQSVPESRLKYKGYGKTEPIIAYDKYNREARLKNQRVEIKILAMP